MKNEIKILYRKDPKLAKQVAKILGYEIKAKEYTEEELATFKLADHFADLKVGVHSLISSFEDVLDKREVAKAPQSMRTLGRSAVSQLKKLEKDLQVLIKKYSL